MKKWKSYPCGDCGVEEGQLHLSGCDMEVCPSCGGQFFWCDCEKDDVEFRIPYLLIPVKCGLCGEQWPEEFYVSNEDWAKFVLPNLQRQVLCLSCYEELKKLWPKGWKNPTL